MADAKKTYDVFISHSASDAKLALEIARACRANGLDPITYGELLPGANASDAIWEALAESRALLAVLSQPGPTPSMAIELGAARAWNKPIFGIVSDPTFARLPPALADVHLYTPGRIDDVIRAIKITGNELTDDDRLILGKLYMDMGISVDQLALDPRPLQDLVKQFSSGTAKIIPGERLLSELLRMRKQGQLTRGRRKNQSKSRR